MSDAIPSEPGNAFNTILRTSQIPQTICFVPLKRWFHPKSSQRQPTNHRFEFWHPILSDERCHGIWARKCVQYYPKDLPDTANHLFYASKPVISQPCSSPLWVYTVPRVQGGKSSFGAVGMAEILPEDSKWPNTCLGYHKVSLGTPTVSAGQPRLQKACAQAFWEPHLLSDFLGWIWGLEWPKGINPRP